jgi:branched-subunit amino acid aminotransferase/4-amino-4-deoxychorismate lyase
MSDHGTSSRLRIGGDELSKHDWGLLYGFGLFETVRVYDGIAALLDEHIERMSASAIALGFDVALERSEIASRAAAFCRSFRERLVRLTLTRGNPDLGLPASLLLSDRAVPYAMADKIAGIAIHIASTRRNETSPTVAHKTLNQLENMLAWRDALANGCRESLFFNTAGHLAEGSRSNVFIVSGNQVRTPAISCGILPGVTRRAVIAALSEAGVHVEEGELRLEELLACNECFLTSAGMEVMPVHRIGDRRLSTVSGPLTVLAAACYGAIVRRTVARAAADAAMDARARA